jgi:hypothetical protein
MAIKQQKYISVGYVIISLLAICASLLSPTYAYASALSGGGCTITATEGTHILTASSNSSSPNYVDVHLHVVNDSDSNIMGLKYKLPWNNIYNVSTTYGTTYFVNQEDQSYNNWIFLDTYTGAYYISPHSSADVVARIITQDSGTASTASSPFTIEASSGHGSASTTDCGYSGYLSSTPYETPPAPTTATGTAGNASATLDWTTVTGATSYRVVRDSDSSEVYNGTALTYTDTSLTNGTAYLYHIYAHNGAGDSTAVDVTVTPVAPDTGGGGGDTDITTRDIKIISFAISCFIAYKFLQYFKYKGND